MRCRNRLVPGSRFRVPGSLLVGFASLLFAGALTTALIASGPAPSAPAIDREGGQAKPATTAKPATPAPTAPAQAPAQPPQGYAGSEACATCHTGYDSSINATKHGFTSNPNTPMAKLGCESCHGPGEAHMNDPEKVKPKQLAKISAKEVNATCTTCHNKGPHALWNGS